MVVHIYPVPEDATDSDIARQTVTLGNQILGGNFFRVPGVPPAMSDSNEQLAVWCAGKEWCPITSTATVIGKKWHPVVVHRLIQSGPMGFNELKDDVDGISSKVLSDSLEDLEEKGLVNREIVSEKPVRVEYSLTDRGASLESLIEEMHEWGEKHLAAAVEKESAIS